MRTLKNVIDNSVEYVVYLSILIGITIALLS